MRGMHTNRPTRKKNNNARCHSDIKTTGTPYNIRISQCVLIFVLSRVADATRKLRTHQNIKRVLKTALIITLGNQQVQNALFFLTNITFPRTIGRFLTVSSRAQKKTRAASYLKQVFLNRFQICACKWFQVSFANMIHHLLLTRTLCFFFIVDFLLKRAIGGGGKRNEGKGVMHKRTVEERREKERENLSEEIDR